MPKKPSHPKKYGVVRKVNQHEAEVAAHIMAPLWIFPRPECIMLDSFARKFVQHQLEENARYPLKDHASVWSVTGRENIGSRRFVVYHSYTNARTLEQIEFLRSNLKDRGDSCLVVRDALWGQPDSPDRSEIKQVFIFGAAVDQALVLSKPYGFMDCQCSEPLPLPKTETSVESTR